ncbi:alpha/beta hydrolase [Nonomuraea longicatena]
MEQKIDTNGVQLWCETFGDPSDPAVLLVMGLGAQGITWPEPLCKELQEAGRYVIRYDNRDTGLSSVVDFDERPYTMTDLAADAVGLLDGLGVGTAHVVGASMGGMIGQELALEHPERLRTLTLIMSSAAAADRSKGGFAGTETDPEVAAWTEDLATNPPTTVEGLVQTRIDLARIVHGSLGDFDEEAVRKTVMTELTRSSDVGRAMDNHTKAFAASRDRTGLISQITVPTLVIHGTEDRLAPFAHGKAMAEAIEGSVFLPVEGMGHGLSAAVQDIVIPAVIAHTR